MFSLKLGTTTAVVLTDRRIIKQLLDKKASTSSNRPKNEVSQMIGEGDHMLLMDNTPTWRIYRKQIHQVLTESLCDKTHSKLQHAETVQMLHDMLATPHHWANHLKRFSNSVIMSIGKTTFLPHSWTQEALAEAEFEKFMEFVPQRSMLLIQKSSASWSRSGPESMSLARLRLLIFSPS